MTTSDVDHLIHTVLDGEASVRDRQRLEEIVARSPEARRELEETQRLFTELAAAREVEAPAGLAESVMRQLRDARVAPHPEPLAFDPARRRRRGLFAAGWAAAAAIAIVLAWPLVRQPAEDPAATSGAMIERPGWEEVARAATASGSLRVSVFRSGERVSVETWMGRAGTLRMAWSGGIEPQGRPTGAKTMQVDCAELPCPAVPFVRVPGPAPTLTVTAPDGVTLEITID